MSTVNPYEAPLTPVVESLPGRLEWPQFGGRFFSAFWRWLVICSISAAPSFFLGCHVAETAVGQVAMICGILTFVIAYSYADVRFVHDWSASNRALKRSLYAVYGLRLLMSIAFPVGMFIDMFSGIVSISIVSALLNASFEGGDPASFFAIYLTTLVQGAILNVMLMGLLGIIYTLLVSLRTNAELHPGG